jgi:F-type H+-transporting ATPase subunit epsilon
MGAGFKLEIITPLKAWPARDVVSLVAPGDEGPFTVLARHEPLVALLKAGPLRIGLEDGTGELWTVSGGVLTVEQDRVIVLAERASPDTRSS